MIDFFEKTTQNRIIEIALNVSRHSANRKDYEAHLLPLMPAFSQMLQMRGESNKKLVENMTTVFLTLTESFSRIHHPKVEFGQISQLFESLQNTGIIEGL